MGQFEHPNVIFLQVSCLSIVASDVGFYFRVCKIKSVLSGVRYLPPNFMVLKKKKISLKPLMAFKLPYFILQFLGYLKT
jgi:hypothetical protein